MTLSRDLDAQGGLESVSKAERVASLTGIRAVAALLVMLTHAAYTTGKYNHGYVGLVYSRMEIGVPIFFVLSGFLVVRPVGQGRRLGRCCRRRCAATPGTGCAASCRPTSSPCSWRMPLYHFRTAGPNPGHTWMGLFRNLTLSQIYTDNYLYSYLHQGLTQMWSLAVEVAFYVVLPLLAYLLLVVLCRRRWRPMLLLTGLSGLALITPAWLILVHTTDFLPDGARLWLPTYLAVVHRRHDACGPAADGSARVRDGMRAIGVGLLFHRLYADRRRPDHVTGRTCGRRCSRRRSTR